MKINKGRIAVLIGKSGATKNAIEKRLGVKMDLNSKTGDCNIRGDFNNPNYNPININIPLNAIVAPAITCIYFSSFPTLINLIP